MSDEYVLINGEYYRRVNAPPQLQVQFNDPTQVRDLGTMLSEAALQGQGRSLISPAPQSALPLQNPMGFQCPGCGHQVIEKGCNIHSDSEPYSWFDGFTPASYYHRKCLANKLAERMQQLNQQYGMPQIDR